MHVLVMGVSGSGKSTVGKLLAEQLGLIFVEADEFHSAANRAKMHADIPLTDEDRWPWLRSIHSHLLTLPNGWVVGCSALRQSYRDLLFEGLPKPRVVFLTGSKERLTTRLEQRRGHFVDEGLLASQLATLEPPHDAIIVDVSPEPDEIVRQILERLDASATADASE